MTVTLKSREDIINYITDNGNKKIDDNIEAMVNQLAGTTIKPIDYKVNIVNGIISYEFYADLGPTLGWYRQFIDPNWIESYDLEEQVGQIICVRCHFRVSPESEYQYQKEKIFDEETQEYRKVLWKDVMDPEYEDSVVCPLCNSTVFRVLE